MSDEGTAPGERSERSPRGNGNGMSSDTFDVLGTEIAALLRSTHEISARTRREADEAAKTRLADASVQAEARLAEAEEQSQARLAAANERLAQAERDAEARLAEAEERLAQANREVEARLNATNEQAAEIARREEAAEVLLGLVTELAARLERRAKRSAVESQATIDELEALKAAMPTTVAAPVGADGAPEVIDLRDPPPVDDSYETMPKGKGKHKRRRKGGAENGKLLMRSRSADPS